MNSRVIGILVISCWLAFAGCAVNDQKIAQDVNTNLGRVANLGRHSIEVESSQGNVILGGEVGSVDARMAAEDAAWRTDGVVSVRNELKVNGSQGGNRLVDLVWENIGRSAKLTDRYQLSISGNGTEVTLNGHTASDRDAALIERLARETPGVTAVRNNLSTEYSESNKAVEARVREVLATTNIPTQNLLIDANNGTVTFRGSLASTREVDQVLANALMVDGVKDVHSELLVRGQRYTPKLNPSGEI